MRERWINIAKCMAILAVMTDHTYNVLYTNEAWRYCSFFSVSLFILAMGITSYWSYGYSENKLSRKVAMRIRKIMIPYGIAVVVYFIATTGYFDFMAVLNYFIHFNVSGPHYYVFLYLQLLLLSPIIYRFVIWTRKWGNMRVMLQILGGGSAVGIAIWTTNNTNILNIRAGGGKLFGGTYLILFYIGMLVADWYDKVNLRGRAFAGICMTVFAGLTFVIGRFICIDSFDLDLKFPFGEGINPPGISLMLYSFMVMFFIFYVVKFAEHFHFKFVECIISVFDYIGRHTLYIFLYHKYFFDYFLVKANFGTNRVINVLIYFTVMIGGSILLEYILSFASEFIDKSYNMCCD